MAGDGERNLLVIQAKAGMTMKSHGKSEAPIERRRGVGRADVLEIDMLAIAAIGLMRRG
jgi:hypothetical protein